MAFGYNPKVDNRNAQLQKTLFGSTKKSVLKDVNVRQRTAAKSMKQKVFNPRGKENSLLSPLTLKSFNGNSRGRVDTPQVKIFQSRYNESAEDEEEQEDEIHHPVAHASDSDEESDWYEGRALIANLKLDQGKSLEPEDSSRKLAVVEDLHDAFEAHATDLKNNLTEGLVSALDHVSQIHAVIEGSADKDIKNGIETFYSASTTAHELRLKVQAHLKRSLDESQINIKSLFLKLNQAYQKRDALWEELGSSFEQCAENAVTTFETLETSIKHTETLLDKRCRVLNHEANNKERQGVLKKFLDNL